MQNSDDIDYGELKGRGMDGATPGQLRLTNSRFMHSLSQKLQHILRLTSKICFLNRSRHSREPNYCIGISVKLIFSELLTKWLKVHAKNIRLFCFGLSSDCNGVTTMAVPQNWECPFHRHTRDFWVTLTTFTGPD